MSEIDISTWNPDPALNESIGDIPLNSNASIAQTWQAIQMLMAAARKNGLQLVPFTGATSQEDGSQGLVPAPEAGEQDKLLRGDGTWGTLSSADIPSLDASKITSGTIDIGRLPAGALERLVTVADQTARYALTTADVQLGDTVKQLDTGVMYIVVDTSKLNQAAGYVEYTAGSATTVPWSGVTGKPSDFTPSSHSHGSITNDGKLGTASRAVVTDANGAIDVSSVTTAELDCLSGVTSALQTQINGKANDNAVVHASGNETVAGTKTFSSSIYTSNSSNSTGFYVRCLEIAREGAWPTQIIHFAAIDKNFKYVGDFTINGYTIGTSLYNNAQITLYNPSNASAVGKTISFNSIDWTSFSFAPDGNSDNLVNLGNASCRWKQLFAGTATISTSDERCKDSTADIPDKVLDAWGKVGWKQFRFTDAVREKGDKARLHSGAVAQEVERVFSDAGLDVSRYGLFCHDEWDAEPEQRDKNGDVIREAVPAGDRYSLRYEEALCMEAAYQRRRADRLEARLAEIEARLTALEVADA